jgi:PPM family protein phosphatase
MSSIIWYAESITGLREKNEDSFLARKAGEHYLLVVADGLGGHAAGEIASATAVAACNDRAEQPINDGKEFLLDCLALAEFAVLKKGQERPEWWGMGTTLLAALVRPDGTGLLMNVGDSRGHMINGKISHTRDQNMAQEMVQSGRMTEEEAMASDLSKMLNQALGDIEPPVPDFYSIDIKGKYLLLSSDGLHGFVHKETIRKIVLEGGSDLPDTVKKLMDEALRCGSDDNITIILAKEEE